MTYYSSLPRQQGGGVGSLLSSLTRYIIPHVGRAAGSLIRSQAARKMAPKLASAGVGIMKDLATKQSLKQTLKRRGAQLMTDVIKGTDFKKIPHSGPRKRTRKTRKKSGRVNRPRARNNNRKRRNDIFD